MKFKLFPITAIVLAGLATAGVAHAQAKPEETLKMRQGLFQAIKTNFGPIGAVAKGEAPLSADTAARAENLAALAKIAPMGFPAGSENIAGGKTKPEAWQKAEFKAGFEALQAESAKLAEVAKGGDVNALKAQVGAVGKTCKACHDSFRAE